MYSFTALRKIAILLSLLILTVLFGSCIKSSTLDEILRAGQDTPLDEQTVVAGLKEALQIGTQRAVDNTSRLDGFLGNAIIRVVMPEEFKGAASTLRDIGLGGQVDKFELAMNRAAERASGEAVDVFWNAITSMSLADAFGILNGPETAATDYFRINTEATLRQRFAPIVQQKMSEVGLYQIYGELTDYYNNIPLVTKPALDLDGYITDRTLNGLFTILGQEESRIRKDPVARTTALLKRVFGNS
jgi:hypothetical protein